MTPKEALEAMCDRCHKNIQSIPSKGYLPHRECPFRHISGDYCEEYDTLKKALGETGMTSKQLRAKLDVLEYSGIVSYSFLHTIGLDDDNGYISNGKKVKCYRNYYSSFWIPLDIQNYIDKGYMEQYTEVNLTQFKFFKVTEKGFAWLSKLLGIKVEEVK